uniref:Ig-like domain-containing protein n=1 Tax=Neogobius melanostomus TaxID=47308 RepID=A0A8C6WIP2_9GOBI
AAVSQTLMVPSQPLVVPVGSEVTLPCELESVKNIKDLVVDWARPDLKPRYVHIRRDGHDLLIDQNSLYLGRTRLSERGLAYGDMSLTLSRVRLSDAGTYHCFIPQMDTRVTLHVEGTSETYNYNNLLHSGLALVPLLSPYFLSFLLPEASLLFILLEEMCSSSVYTNTWVCAVSLSLSLSLSISLSFPSEKQVEEGLGSWGSFREYATANCRCTLSLLLK